MSSKSGGQEVLKGRALSASHTKPTERLNLSFDEIFVKTAWVTPHAAKMAAASRSCAKEEKVCEFSFKAISNGGLGGEDHIEF